MGQLLGYEPFWEWKAVCPKAEPVDSSRTGITHCKYGGSGIGDKFCTPIEGEVNLYSHLARACRIVRRLVGICVAVVALLIGRWIDAAETRPAERRGGYQFDRTISREVLENYLSRSITVEGVFNGRGDLDDNIRMLDRIGREGADRPGHVSG